jgi:hypothetical protein
MADEKSFLSTDERVLLSTLRAQLIRCSVLTLPNEEQERLAPAGRAVCTPHVDIDCTLTSDEEQAPAMPERKHARKIPSTRWLTHDACLTEFKERDAARVAKEARRGQPRARAPVRARARTTAVGRGGGQGRGRGRGGGAAPLVSCRTRRATAMATRVQFRRERGLRASEDAKIGRPMHARTECELFLVDWEDYRESFSFTWDA